jgi:hypothetical protein
MLKLDAYCPMRSIDDRSRRRMSTVVFIIDIRHGFITRRCFLHRIECYFCLCRMIFMSERIELLSIEYLYGLIDVVRVYCQ